MWRDEQTTDTVGMTSGLGEAFIEYKVNKSVQNKQGIWCPRHAGGSVKEGQCSEGKGPGKLRSPAAARAPLFGSAVRGAAASSTLACGTSWRLNGPASWPAAVSRVRFTSGPQVQQLVTSAALVPSTLPYLTHEDTSVHAQGRDWSPEE
ncbi:hypothetical protein M9458_005713, partial [Cirrhinus mrigala]